LGAAESVKFGAAVTVRLIVVVWVKAPEVPVMVTVVGPPVVAEALAVRVSTLVPVVGFVAKPAVTPLGNPDAARLTLPVNPLVGLTVIVLVPLLPWTILKVLGEAESVKLGCGVTVRLMVVVSGVKAPEVPVMVTVVGPPVVAEPLAVSVSTLVPVVGFVAKPAVTPLGRPDAARVTLPENPLVGVTVIVLVPLLPWTILKVLGEAESVKFGAAVTVRLMVVVSGVKAPEVPVMVTVTGPPVVARALAVRVSTLVPVVGFVAKPAVTPLGKPEAARVTLPVNPLVGLTVMVLVPLDPWAMLKVLGAAESVKLGCGVTVRLMVVVSGVKAPEVPVMVTVVGPPIVAEALAVSVSRLVPVVGLVAKPAVTPLGRPDAARVTLPENPLVGLTVIVLVLLLPCATLKVLGAADSVKLGGGVTLRLTLVV